MSPRHRPVSFRPGDREEPRRPPDELAGGHRAAVGIPAAGLSFRHPASRALLERHDRRRKWLRARSDCWETPPYGDAASRDSIDAGCSRSAADPDAAWLIGSPSGAVAFPGRWIACVSDAGRDCARGGRESGAPGPTPQPGRSNGREARRQSRGHRRAAVGRRRGRSARRLAPRRGRS